MRCAYNEGEGVLADHRLSPSTRGTSNLGDGQRGPVEIHK